jgi:GNAT superfamily N-acetyltransferase
MARWKDGAGAPVNAGYAIERAAPTHIRFLPEIEREAAKLFIGHGVPESVINEETSEAEFRQAERDGLLWVAVSELGASVGFARVETLDGAAHLEEIDVHPAHGRRGIGSALVRAVCDWARQSELSAVTLTTFRDIPWNAPFYARLGFFELAADRWSPSLAVLVREEAERGLESERRVVMSFATGTPQK